ncbi:MAG: cyclase family protein [Candidatus Rokubacteria bacterium]|nr:cyclase family protein [Candidatus Rokubacteria bacterium]MBI3109031.1 cyclase family protein [Candidatus Rokubacteria bacterium]
MALVDLSVLTSPTMGVPPALRSNRPKLETVVRPSTQSQEMVRIGFIRNLCIHTGTHVDAPCHALTGKREIAEVELDRLVGEAVVLDLGEVAANEAVDRGHLEAVGRDVRGGDIVVLYSHWSERRWGHDDYWTDSPYLTLDAARWLVAQHPRAIVFDFFEEYDARFADFDPIGFKVHREILGHDVLIVEHVVNLRTLPRRGAQFFAAPLKLDGMDGSPVRAFALVP